MKTHIKKLCDEWYNKGRADYEAECQKIFEDNPPMHFNHEQIMWLKEFVKIRCNQARADAIDELSDLIDRLLWDYDKETYKDLSESFKESARLLKEQKK